LLVGIATPEVHQSGAEAAAVQTLA